MSEPGLAEPACLPAHGRVLLRRAVLRDIAFVTANLRDPDRREIRASADLASTVEAAVIAFETSRDWCWTAHLSGQPIAAFGTAATSPLTPHIRTAWAFGTNRFRRAVPAISRFAKREWPGRLEREGVRRLEVRSLAGHDIAQRWLAGLGARQEGELSAYGTGGETFQLWAWTSRSARPSQRDQASAERVSAMRP